MLSSKPGWVKLRVHSTSALIVLEPKIMCLMTVCHVLQSFLTSHRVIFTNSYGMLLGVHSVFEHPVHHLM